jgi:hypothetical protein
MQAFKGKYLGGGVVTGIYFIDTQFIKCQLGGNLAGIFFIIGLAMGQQLSVYDGPNGKEAAAAFDALIEGFELEVLAVPVGPAVEFVLMVDLEVFEVVEEEVGGDHPFDDPLAGLFKTLVQVDGADDGLEGIAKDLAHFQAAVELVEIADLFETHFYGDLVELVAVDHFAPHFRQKPFFFVGVFFEEEVGDDGA